MKRKACEEVGIASFGADLPDTATQQEVLDTVQQLNANPDVHGILVQLPVSLTAAASTGSVIERCQLTLLCYYLPMAPSPRRHSKPMQHPTLCQLPSCPG